MRALFRNLSDRRVDVVLEPLGDIRSVDPGCGVEVVGDADSPYEVTFDGAEIKVWEEGEAISLTFGDFRPPDRAWTGSKGGAPT